MHGKRDSMENRLKNTCFCISDLHTLPLRPLSILHMLETLTKCTVNDSIGIFQTLSWRIQLTVQNKDEMCGVEAGGYS